MPLRARFCPPNPGPRHPSPFRLSSAHLRRPSVSRQLLATANHESLMGEKYQKASFYRTKLDIRPLSCNWEELSDWRFFCVSPQWHDLTTSDFFIQRVCKIHDPVRPLAFLPLPDACIAFEAGGEYFYLDTCTDFLERFGGDFASDDAFLAALTRPPGLTGTTYRFPNDTDNLYAAVWEEQEKLKQAAGRS
ncbi:hypothetical protein C8R45DRAFT_1103443 [Mycena sanguinolenta]|nr:hypothetical protein C8R45DRAFT_1103443 [Mycena sanguinolenta]